jgi:hypothetical protein
MRTHRLLRDAQSGSSRIRVIFNDFSRGYAIANNVAASEARGKVLVFLNSDTFPANNAVRILAHLLAADEEVGVAQGLLVYPQDLRVQSAGHLFGPYFNNHVLLGRRTDAEIVRRPADRQALTSAFYAVRRADFIQNNGFDEFYLNCFEGMEFSLRMNLKGYRCIYRPTAIAYHIQGASRRRVAVEEAQSTAYFWTKWGHLIRSDLREILAAQLDSADTSRKYLVVNTSTKQGWPAILDSLGIRGEEVAALNTGEQINLHEALIPELHQSNSPILFITNNFRQIARNMLWFADRRDRGDLILDCHGNVISARELFL